MLWVDDDLYLPNPPLWVHFFQRLPWKSFQPYFHENSSPCIKIVPEMFLWIFSPCIKHRSIHVFMKIPYLTLKIITVNFSRNLSPFVLKVVRNKLSWKFVSLYQKSFQTNFHEVSSSCIGNHSRQVFVKIPLLISNIITDKFSRNVFFLFWHLQRTFLMNILIYQYILALVSDDIGLYYEKSLETSFE